MLKRRPASPPSSLSIVSRSETTVMACEQQQQQNRRPLHLPRRPFLEMEIEEDDCSYEDNEEEDNGEDNNVDTKSNAHPHLSHYQFADITDRSGNKRKQYYGLFHNSISHNGNAIDASTTTAENTGATGICLDEEYIFLYDPNQTVKEQEEKKSEDDDKEESHISLHWNIEGSHGSGNDTRDGCVTSYDRGEEEEKEFHSELHSRNIDDKEDVNERENRYPLASTYLPSISATISLLSSKIRMTRMKLFQIRTTGKTADGRGEDPGSLPPIVWLSSLRMICDDDGQDSKKKGATARIGSISSKLRSPTSSFVSSSSSMSQSKHHEEARFDRDNSPPTTPRHRRRVSFSPLDNTTNNNNCIDDPSKNDLKHEDGSDSSTTTTAASTIASENDGCSVQQQQRERDREQQPLVLVKIYETIHRSEYTVEEKRASWYTKDEYRRFKWRSRSSSSSAKRRRRQQQQRLQQQYQHQQYNSRQGIMRTRIIQDI